MPSRAEQEAMLDALALRLVAEHEAYMGTTAASDQLGEPENHNRTYRVTGDNWRRHHYKDATGAIKTTAMRAVGTDVTVTLADGTTEIRAVSSFRKQNIATKQRQQATAKQVVSAGDSYFTRVSQLGATGNID